MGDCSDILKWLPFGLGLFLFQILGVMYSSPHKKPVLYWMAVFAQITIPVCLFILLGLLALMVHIIQRLVNMMRRVANRNQTTAAVAAVQEQTLQPELREPPNTNGAHSFRITSLPTCIYDKEAVEDGPICPICKELLGKNDVMIRLPVCVHSFHKQCIESWLQRNLTCPVCRCRVDMEIPGDIALIID